MVINFNFYVVSLALFFFSVSPSRANVVGPDAQNFNSITSGVDFVTVQSSETLSPGIMNFGLFFNYAINTLPLFEDPELQSRVKYNDALLMADFNVGLGLLPNWEVGFSYPRLMHQDVNAGDDVPRGQFGATGNTELRFMTKVKFLGNDTYGLATVLSTNINRIRNNPYTGINPGPSYNVELVGDVALMESMTLGLNLGYRMRNPGSALPGSAIAPTEDQMIYSSALNFLVKPIRSKLIFEIFGSEPAKKSSNPASKRQASSLEMIGGFKTDITTQLAFHAGAGTELMSGVSSPDWRVYTGLNYTIGPIFGKKDQGTIVRPKGPSTRTDDPLELPVESGQTTITLDAIQFEFDSSDRLLPGSEETLERLVTYLLKPPVFRRVTVVGHTDYLGSDEYNLNLSIRRSWTIRKILIEKYKLDPDMVYARGFGKRVPVADNGNYQGRQRNRRVEFVISR
jgi:outer membrane protein OmpA-like peptidoglycan-associated protein